MPASSTSVPSPAASSGGAVVSYGVAEFRDDWIIPEVPVPESAWHDGCLELFKALLVAWVQRAGLDAAVFRDIAILAKKERPRVGFNPDVCVVTPAPRGHTELESLRLWEHSVPRLAFEVVGPNHPYKDYAIVPEKCAVVGVAELIVFDPLLAGPKAQGGPWLLQVWRRSPSGAFERVHAGDSPAWSTTLGAFVVPERETRRLIVSEQPDGSSRWKTREELAVEAEQAAREAEHAAREAERAALARVVELEARLAGGR